jgi:hypothetical protein
LQCDVLHDSVNVAVGALERAIRVKRGRSGRRIDFRDCRTALLGRCNGRAHYGCNVTRSYLVARASSVPKPVAGIPQPLTQSIQLSVDTRDERLNWRAISQAWTPICRFACSIDPTFAAWN